MDEKLKRQITWQRKKRDGGLCSICGKRKLVTKHHCEVCRLKANKRSLARYYRGKENGS